MPILPEPKDATRDKINEARYFLQQLEYRRDAYLSGQGDSEVCLLLFRYYLSAFLCSARSILDYMKNQYSLEGKPAFRKFDGRCMQRNGKFREFKFFNDIRVENVHYKYGIKEPYKVKQRDQYILTPIATMLLVGSDEDCTSNPVLQQSIPNLQPSTQESLISQKLPIELLFLKQDGFLDQDIEVIEFCTRQLKTMIGLVELCEKGKFTVEELDAFTLPS